MALENGENKTDLTNKDAESNAALNELIEGFKLLSLSNEGYSVIAHISECSSCKKMLKKANQILPKLQKGTDSTSTNTEKLIVFVKGIQNAMFKENKKDIQQSVIEFLESLNSTLSCAWRMEQIKDVRNLSILSSYKNYTRFYFFDKDYCSICLEDYKTRDLIRTTPCEHEFHASCVDFWLEETGTCPLCRRIVKSTFSFCCKNQ